MKYKLMIAALCVAAFAGTSTASMAAGPAPMPAPNDNMDSGPGPAPKPFEKPAPNAKPHKAMARFCKFGPAPHDQCALPNQAPFGSPCMCKTPKGPRKGTAR